MKLEIEVSEAELKDALERHIRTAVADRVNSWGEAHNIKTLVQAKYKELVAEIVEEELRNAPKIREHVQTALVNKIKGQLTAALKGPK